MQGMPVSCQADPHIGTADPHVRELVDDSTLLVIRCVGVGHLGTLFQSRRRILIPVRGHRQVHKMAGSYPCDQHRQTLSSEVYQVNSVQVWGPKQSHH